MDDISLIAGSAYAFIGFFPVPLYARIIWVFLKHSEFRGHQCYFLMAQIGIFDCLVILGEATFGVTVASDHHLFGLTEYIGIPVAAAAWMAMLGVNLVLSVNRLKVLCELEIPLLFDKMLMWASWLFGFFFLFSYASRLSPLIISEDGLSFFYDMDISYAVVVEHCELYSAIMILGFTFLIYVYVIGHIIKQRTKFSASKTAVRTQEIILLGQSLFVFVICCFLEITWNIGDYILPASPWSGCVVNAVFILHSGWINPGICLIFNTKVRRSVFNQNSQKMFAKSVMLNRSVFVNAATPSTMPKTAG
ncbi:hypothetical protein L596_015437 [Steinernema carpocapsae]|uniref:7TM GPCR serpentine receptor class x (Srx) domain-containing protein n=1 Tax=Steinernema carpocapsae TaxID=34508 RepID=A0A4U5NG95_STECR|nr:hypothetical protein L596_015437 [Steinernema carpocapsae]